MSASEGRRHSPPPWFADVGSAFGQVEGVASFAGFVGGSRVWDRERERQRQSRGRGRRLVSGQELDLADFAGFGGGELSDDRGCVAAGAELFEEAFGAFVA